MPTPFSHPATALVLVPWFRSIARPSIVIAAVVLSLLPDIDLLGYRLGIPYASMFGHRGLTHSLPFAALVVAPVAWWFGRRNRANPITLWFYLFIAMGSHGFLDACTNGGLGVAFLSPFDETRYRFFLHPIKVAPLTVAQLFAARGWAVIQSELLWVWCPALAVAAAGYLLRRR